MDRLVQQGETVAGGLADAVGCRVAGDKDAKRQAGLGEDFDRLQLRTGVGTVYPQSAVTI